MPVVTWDHVHLRSPDPEATAAWLRDILGGEIYARRDGST
jgi:catechol 2,3-dioxygenase-like lactoylglutathione lyase family enzyme